MRFTTDEPVVKDFLKRDPRKSELQESSSMVLERLGKSSSTPLIDTKSVPALTLFTFIHPMTYENYELRNTHVNSVAGFRMLEAVRENMSAMSRRIFRIIPEKSRRRANLVKGQKVVVNLQDEWDRLSIKFRAYTARHEENLRKIALLLSQGIGIDEHFARIKPILEANAGRFWRLHTMLAEVKGLLKGEAPKKDELIQMLRTLPTQTTYQKG